MDRNAKDAQILDQYRRQHKGLTAKLGHIGFIWAGSVQSLWTRCGKPGCACSEDPQARHGPYVYWTSKKKGRTVARLLHTPEVLSVTFCDPGSSLLVTHLCHPFLGTPSVPICQGSL